MKKPALYSGILLVLVISLAANCATGDLGATIDARVGVSAAVALTESHLEGLMSTMQVMAQTAEVQSVDWNTMEGLLAQFEQTSIPLLAWFVRPDGSYFGVGVGLAAANLADRSYFPKTMAGEMTVGELVVSRATGKKAIIATVPVKEAGEVVGALGISVFAAQLSHILLQEMDLPEDVVFYAVNETEQVALHSDPDLIMQDAGELTPLSLSVTKVSDQLGWRFVLGLP
jgi:hypothetical protein